MSASGSVLEWSTLFGGDRSDEIPFDVELDGQGRPVIVGETAAWGSKDFPATPGSYDPDPALGFTEVFAARLSSDGSALQWATAFGGNDWDTAFDAALDGDGDLHVAGTTESRTFPTTPGAFDRLCNDDLEEFSCTNHPDAFALELSADGSQLLASTYIGGAGYEEGFGIAVDAAGRSYVAGGSSSSFAFPLVDAFQTKIVDSHAWCAARADCSDAFLVRLDRAKTRVEYGTFHGGLSEDMARGVTLADGDAWIAGLTHSPNVATTAGVPQPDWAGGNCSFLRDSLEFDSCSDAFIARIDEARPPSPPPSTGGGSGGSGGGTSGGGTTGAPEAPGGGMDTAKLRRVERGLTIRIRGRRVVGRVRATAAPACARNVPVRLERRRGGVWRLRMRARTGHDRRFALALPRTTKRLRVRLPAITRLDSGTHVRCVSASRRVAG